MKLTRAELFFVVARLICTVSYFLLQEDRHSGRKQGTQQVLLQPENMGINASKLAAQADFNNNRVNLYLINTDGLLVTYHVDGFGKWAGPDLFPGGLRFDRQSGITAGPRYGTTITDVFSVTSDGSLSVIPSDLSPNDARLIGFGFPPEAYLATDQQIGIEGSLLAAVNNDGAITVMATGTTGNWGGPNTLSQGSLFKPGAGVAIGVYHTEILADDASIIYAVDNAGAIQVVIVRKDVDTWSPASAINPAGSIASGAPITAGQRFVNGIWQSCAFVIDNSGALLMAFKIPGELVWTIVRVSDPGLFDSASNLVASDQYGTDQLDVFVVDKTGTLTVTSFTPDGRWVGPTQIGPVGLANPTTALAASAQFENHSQDVTQTDVYIIGKDDVPWVFWVKSNGEWNSAPLGV